VRFSRPGDGNENQQADTARQPIADAVRHHDLTALRKLFSADTRAKATYLDSGLAHFLSAFLPASGRGPDLKGGPAASRCTADGFAEELYGQYKVSANRTEYELCFAGITQRHGPPGRCRNLCHWCHVVAHRATGDGHTLHLWRGQFLGANLEGANSGVYVPQK
jgi:hypothetical protein